MKFENSLAFAKKMDRTDPLRKFRSQFHLPKAGRKTAIYFTGNSLGLQPKLTSAFLHQELKDWAALGVEGHVNAKRPWLYYHRQSKKALAQLTGAKTDEVVSMNQLTVNLHLLLASFFRPTAQRFKIITEAGAFSSDQYAIESTLKFHQLKPEKAWIELHPREGETYLRTDDIVDTIHRHGEQLALVMLGGVQYYTGQFFDLRKITEAAHAVGAYAGFDLAHAIGNVPLHLHKDQVDFAVWCSYKYLNSGPGGVAGIFVHRQHHAANLPRLSGWWGHHEAQRFHMKKGFIPMPGADGWQLSNYPVLSGAAHLASLKIFEKAGITALRKKSILLTGFLDFLLQRADPQSNSFIRLTPSHPEERGCQLSIFMKKNGKSVFQKLSKAGVIADWREPGVIRVAPVPLYNTFEEVYRFSEVFKKALR